MKATRVLMGMPIAVEVVAPNITHDAIEKVFAYFAYVDATFSTYKETSEISKLNRGELSDDRYSADLRTILALSEQTKRETAGYFDIWHDGSCDPSGLVKGWAIQQATALLHAAGFHDFVIDAGGDMQIAGKNDGRPWRIGIRNPFDHDEYVKVLALSEIGVATSGTAIRGQHIYDPHQPHQPIRDIVSITVIGPNVYEADRFATAAFAMGRAGIMFIERRAGFEAYMIDAQAQATYTSGFGRFVLSS